MRSWRRRRVRPAPRALRTAISRSRRAMRERVRLATLAHAMRRTKAAAARSSKRVGRASLVNSRCSGVVLAS